MIKKMKLTVQKLTSKKTSKSLSGGEYSTSISTTEKFWFCIRRAYTHDVESRIDASKPDMERRVSRLTPQIQIRTHAYRIWDCRVMGTYSLSRVYLVWDFQALGT